MEYIMAVVNSYQKIAESLLARPLTSVDGYNITSMKKVEQNLGNKLPQPLFDLYTTIGRLPQFMSASQLFALPEQLYYKEGLLIFLEENEGICYWGVDDQLNVFQYDESDNCYDLKLTLAVFLQIILYYQIAQGAEYIYCTNLLDQELAILYQEDSWQLVVNEDDLVIYHLKTYLIWFYKDENDEVLDDVVYFVSLLEIPQQIITKYALEEL